MTVEIFLGDVAEVVRRFDPTRFDAVFCDPPYGIRFMGRRWDYRVPSAETWGEVLRVCKPGAPLLAFGGTKTWHRAAVAIEDAGFLPDDTLMWLHAQGKPAHDNRLKPAWEPAMLFRRAFDGSIEASVEKWGAGLLAIDACRIGASKRVLGGLSRNGKGTLLSGSVDGSLHRETGEESGHDPNVGRWPANIILDEETGAMLDAQAGVRPSGIAVTRNGGGGKINGRLSGRTVRGFEGRPRPDSGYSDSGGPSRFFFCAKADGDETFGNEHVAKKPVRLTTYLARLIRPEKPGSLLVPFCGSGSEIVGAIRAGWTDIVGIDNDPETVAFARERCAAEVSGTTVRAARDGQPGLFGGGERR